MKKIICTVIALAMLLSAAAFAESASFKVGICNYVDDASLNQIVDNIQAQLAAIGEEQGVTFELYEVAAKKTHKVIVDGSGKVTIQIENEGEGNGG